MIGADASDGLNMCCVTLQHLLVEFDGLGQVIQTLVYPGTNIERPYKFKIILCKKLDDRFFYIFCLNH